MAINYLRVPALGLEFPAVNFGVVLVHRALALPERVDIAKRRKIIDFVMSGEFRGFPVAALGEFAVAEQHVNARSKLVHFRADGKSSSHGETLSQRARCRIDSGDSRGGMSFEFARKLTQGHHARNGKHSCFSEGRVEQRGRVPFRKNKPVARRPVWIFRVELHGVKKYAGCELGGGQTRSRMAGA